VNSGDNPAPRRMLQKIRRHLAGDDADAPDCEFVGVHPARDIGRGAASGGDLRYFGDVDDHYFQRTSVTVVPRPGALLMSNSLTSRFAPLNPSPNPPPEV